MTDIELKKMAALMLKYSDPEVQQGMYYPTSNQNRINISQHILTFTPEQLEMAELILRKIETRDLVTGALLT